MSGNAEVDVTLGWALRRLRQAAGLSLREVGDALGITGASVCRYEVADIDIPSSRLSRLLTVLRASEVERLAVLELAEQRGRLPSSGATTSA